MTEKYYTVEQIARMLKIHPKTIQRYIREGKLRANKVGKSWRVTGHELSVFVENEKGAVLPDGQGAERQKEDKVRASAVLDVRVDDRDEAIHIMDTLMAALNSKPPEYGSSSMHAQHIPEENMVRITLWGGPRFLEVMIHFIADWSE